MAGPNAVAGVVLKCNEAERVSVYNKVENEPWYFGVLTRADVEPYLRSSGDFAIRAVENPSGCDLVLSFRASPARICHVAINTDGSKWWLHRRATFPTIADLVNYYLSNDIPVRKEETKDKDKDKEKDKDKDKNKEREKEREKGIRLVKPCERPRWWMKRSNINVNRNVLLGTGNFCDVYEGKLNDRRVIAVKICHTDVIYDPKDKDAANSMNSALFKEAFSMSLIRHPNIISFYGISCDRSPAMIAMEYCPGGSLVNHLQHYDSLIENGERIKYTMEAAQGMQFLHETELVHRDLAARNCLISKHGIIKIGDFGLSKIVSELAGEKVGKQQLPLRWMAPESLVANAVFSKATDVWSFGVMLYEVFSGGEKPFPDWENKKIATHIRMGKMCDFPEKTPPEVSKLVKEHMWRRDPAERMEFDKICARLHQIQALYPPPALADMVVGKHKGVKPVDQSDLLAKQDQTQDIAAAVTMSCNLTQTTHTDDKVHEKERTMEETGNEDHAPDVKKGKENTNESSKKKNNRGQKNEVKVRQKSRTK